MANFMRMVLKLTSLILIGLVQFSWSEGQTSNKDIVFLGANVPPFSWNENDEIVGINIEIAQLAAHASGFSSHSKIVPLKRAFQIIETNQNHFLVGLARTPERERHFKWVKPLITTRIGMLRWQPDPIAANDIRAEICAHYGTPMEYWLKTHNHPDYIIVNDEEACFQLLTNGLVKYWFTEIHLAQYLTKQKRLNTNYLIEEKIIMNPQLFLATSLNTPDAVVSPIKHELDAMKEKGVFNTIINRYIQHD